MTKKENKRGALSDKEKALIQTLSQQKTPITTIAEKINRSPVPVEKYLRSIAAPHFEFSNEDQDYNLLGQKLENRTYYNELQSQLTDDELRYFKQTWVHLMNQFRDNVKFSEELQMKQLIMVDIMINRCMVERKQNIGDIDRLQKLLNAEYDKPEMQQDTQLLANLEQQISYARNSLSAYTTEYTKLLDKQKDINKDLKATREQRVKRIEDSKTSFAGWLRMLEDEAVRERLGQEANIIKMAGEKAREELSEYHTYIDGVVDQPLLTPDTIKNE